MAAAANYGNLFADLLCYSESEDSAGEYKIKAVPSLRSEFGCVVDLVVVCTAEYATRSD